MKFLFTSLVCHRDVEIFKFNWFCSRAHLSNGFDIPHLVLSDGSLNKDDVASLKTLPNVLVEETPITLYDVPKPALLGKLQCHKVAFEKYKADLAILLDCDIFFFQNWEPDLRKILQNRATALRDWGSSLGPNVQQYIDLFGVHEDFTTPNCNTGVIALRRDDYPRVEAMIQKHLDNPFMIMEDQGIVFAACYGFLNYAEGIKCIINNAENFAPLWNWVKSQRGVHLMGMRTRIPALQSLIDHSLLCLPKTIHLKEFSPSYKHISWGLMAYDTYNFTVPLQKIPSTTEGKYVTDALYLHGGSEVRWKLPDRCNKFTTTIKCMDTGIPANVKEVVINGKSFALNSTVDIGLEEELEIITLDGPGSHIALIEPLLHIDVFSKPDISSQINSRN